jgi:hypothetical protein
MTNEATQDENLRLELDEAFYWFSGNNPSKIVGPIDRIGGGVFSTVRTIMRGDTLTSPPRDNRIAWAIKRLDEEGLTPPLGRIVDEIHEKLGITLEIVTISSSTSTGVNRKVLSQIIEVTPRERPPKAPHPLRDRSDRF